MTNAEQINRSVDNDLEFLQELTKVKSQIKDSITEDYVLCKLTEKDKEAITEMTTNAHYCKALIKIVSTKSQKHYTWNTKQKCWELTERPDHEQKMQTYATALFNAFMTRCDMTAILNRNIIDNHLIQTLVNKATEPKEQEEEQTKTLEKVKKLMITPKKNPEGE